MILTRTYSSSRKSLPREKQFQIDITQIYTFKKMLKKINPNIVISCLRGDFNQRLEFHKQLAIDVKNSKGIFVLKLKVDLNHVFCGKSTFFSALD